MQRQDLRSAFRETFSDKPEIMTVAPGRINLIGEHTDYNEGFVFPAAIDRRLYVAARRTDGPSQLSSMQLGKGTPFDAGQVGPNDLDGWAKYGAGMAWAMRELGPIPNIHAVVHSEVPIGSGVSSSAALELAFGVLYNELAGLKQSNKKLALLGQKNENQFVGVNSGIMDQMACAMGRDGEAMFLDTRSLEIDYAPIPKDLSIILCDTKTPRALTASAYNERRTQCEEAAQILGVEALRDATMDQLRHCQSRMDTLVYRRARHVISENDRCCAFREALKSNRGDEMGRLMKESHLSLRDDYEVSSRELNLMAEAAWAAPGCVGARMTGAGFGGACVALVEREREDEFRERVNIAYEKSSGLAGEIIACRAVAGAHVLGDA